nr:uncharacterized protein LOC110437899 [Danio rerio]|eukprot:XP_021322020.1 uncharacterized protein LOC110437899 [Danio rerio]
MTEPCPYFMQWASKVLNRVPVAQRITLMTTDLKILGYGNQEAVYERVRKCMSGTCASGAGKCERSERTGKNSGMTEPCPYFMQWASKVLNRVPVAQRITLMTTDLKILGYGNQEAVYERVRKCMSGTCASGAGKCERSERTGVWAKTGPHEWQFPYGLAVRIPGFHPGGLGSTPGLGRLERFCFCPFRPAAGLQRPYSVRLWNSLVSLR